MVKTITLPRIAVIEDENSIAEMYMFKLQHAGYLVEIANNGQRGLKLIKTFQPELILLDLKMPVMNGDEMLERLRSTNWGKDIKVIILTNISKDEAPSNLRFLGVERYIVKAHHTPQQVIDIIQEVLR